MLVAAAVAGIVVFRSQGTPAGSGVNFYTSSAPVLVAIPVVIIVLRLYPLALRGLLRSSRRTTGAPAFLGLARASRTALTPALPAFALVLALTVAAFAGMVRDAVINGEVAASWQTAGADATVIPYAAELQDPAGRRPGDRRRARRDPRGRGHERALDNRGRRPAQRPGRGPGQLRGAGGPSQGFPQVQAGLIAVPGNGRSAAAGLGVPAGRGAPDPGQSGVVTLEHRAGTVQPVRVRVAGVVASTPALPAGGAFVIMPLAAIRSTATPSEPTPSTRCC